MSLRSLAFLGLPGDFWRSQLLQALPGVPWLSGRSLAGALKVIYQFRRFFLGRNEAFSVARCVWCGKIRVWRLPGALWSSLALSGASWRSSRSLALPGGPFGVPWRSLALPGSPSDVSWRSLALRGAPWRCLALPGASWRSLAPSGVPWRSLGLFAVLWRFQALPEGSGFSWHSLGLSGVTKRSQALLGPPWRSLAFSGVPLPWAPCRVSKKPASCSFTTRASPSTIHAWPSTPRRR